MLWALLPVAVFEFGNLATTSLILRATQLLSSPHRTVTEATSLAILIYAAHNVVATVASLTAGRWYDRTGPRTVFATGAVLYVIAYGVFAGGPHSVFVITLGFALAGAGIGFAEPIQSAVVSKLLPDFVAAASPFASCGDQSLEISRSSITSASRVTPSRSRNACDV
ncbi:major facilitator transporter [Mycobacterium haemophilum DSM 44634]|uniref:MFS transporter n=1 Tax=Mycobacterium haemophilum TaxID=29311 RepID=UPI001EEE4715|nr:MFS transporter [Mycobacterium haemophilum]